MSDLMTGSSTWATGTSDTASSLTNGVDEKKAEHINGIAAFAVALQGKLGSASSLIGNKADLATRLAVSIDADGIITSAMPGDVCMSARSAKTGWLECDGSAVSRTTYADLYAAISTNYGPGDGSTTFNVPDFRGRVPIGAGSGTGINTSGAAGTAPSGGGTNGPVSRGSWGGYGDSYNVSHTHTATDSGHAHQEMHNDETTGAPTLAYQGSGGGAPVAVGVDASFYDTAGSALNTASSAANISVSTDGVAGTNLNYQPYMGIKFFIKT